MKSRHLPLRSATAAAEAWMPGVSGSSSLSGNFLFMIAAQSAMLLGSGASSEQRPSAAKRTCRCCSKSAKNCAKLPRSGEAMLIWSVARLLTRIQARQVLVRRGQQCDSTGEPRAAVIRAVDARRCQCRAPNCRTSGESQILPSQPACARRRRADGVAASCRRSADCRARPAVHSPLPRSAGAGFRPPLAARVGRR